MRAIRGAALGLAMVFLGAVPAAANQIEEGTIVCGTHWTGYLTTITTDATIHDWENRATGETKSRFWGAPGGQLTSHGYSNSAWTAETSGILSIRDTGCLQ